VCSSDLDGWAFPVGAAARFGDLLARAEAARSAADPLGGR